MNKPRKWPPSEVEVWSAYHDLRDGVAQMKLTLQDVERHVANFHRFSWEEWASVSWNAKLLPQLNSVCRFTLGKFGKLMLLTVRKGYGDK
jgi:hypothetical protein